ncbi:MAG TPA: CHAP domain-containing protein [Candidatus Saccharimonadales bacterium]|nr:CHAP domain-containing protein [Candidatus Saccharimonadales bacterium]
MQRVRSKIAKIAIKKRTVRLSLLFFNVVLLAAILFFVMRGNATTSQFQSALSTNTAATDPIDQLSSADIAVSISRSIAMPEATAVTNQADTVKAELAVTAANSVVTKPQVVATSLKSRRDIQSYITVDGDTISSVAAKFNVTSDSIRWSNNVTGDAVGVGVALTIPPLNGIVYTVADGDTPQSLAAKYSASADQIIAFNDAEINGLKPGEKIIIPNGKVQQIIRAASSSYGSGFSYGSSAIYGYNGYDRGFCTYYVASRVAVPSNWGNANTWDNLAPLSGWTVSSTPRAGAIAQSDRGSFGHVAYVEAVSADGTQIKYSDMNGLAGFNKVGYSGWVPASSFPHYIYR